jgi:hypothetical protein
MRPQIRCRVAFASPPGDPVAKYPPAVLVGPVRSIDRAAALDALQYLRQLRRGKGANGTLAELGKYVHFNGRMVLLECPSAHPGAACKPFARDFSALRACRGSIPVAFCLFISSGLAHACFGLTSGQLPLVFHIDLPVEDTFCYHAFVPSTLTFIASSRSSNFMYALSAGLTLLIHGSVSRFVGLISV